jgi:hypothetical protein
MASKISLSESAARTSCPAAERARPTRFPETWRSRMRRKEGVSGISRPERPLLFPPGLDHAEFGAIVSGVEVLLADTAQSDW